MTAPPEFAPGPLAGIRVVELAGIGPGPFACMVLADLGADVVRVDRLQDGELDLPAGADLLNRGKRSVRLDLKHADGVAAVLALVRDADVLVEGLRPGALERLGLGPDVLLRSNPRIVVGRMTGWGQDGPLANSAGHDIAYIAVTGALHAIGGRDAGPQIPLNLVGDFGGGSLYLVVGILAALLEATRTGHGQVVDAAIVDGTVHLLTLLHAMMAVDRWVDERESNTVDGGAPFYAVYETADRRHMAVGALEARFYRELLRILELDEDPTRQHDESRWPALRAALAERFRTRTQSEWTELFAGTDACVAPVRSLAGATSDPHLRARGSFVAVDGVVQPAIAPRLSRHTGRQPGRPSRPGADTRSVLAAAGLDVDALLASGVAAGPGVSGAGQGPPPAI